MSAKKTNPRSANAGDKALGEKIRARRILAKMSQAELGDHVGV
jgi:transcriptional regulator with XRE-family HTH domain